MPMHESLYRRFRPQRFDELIGQPLLVRALRGAVADDRVGHAFLLSGPRGTGKTSSARILAKALNCEQLDAGEPCGTCPSCTAIAAGTSLDLIELDAASHNSVDDIRQLTETAGLVGGGRRKVYLLDEVHMLSTAASNALLKTLEEPPSHVVFVLATTDPERMLPTIRSRTQQFALTLVGNDELAAHLRSVAQQAEIELDDDTVAYVLERGAGSVRDALSALDTVVVAGGITPDRDDAQQILDGLVRRDVGAVLDAVQVAVQAGVDPRELTASVIRKLRDQFVAADRGEESDGLTQSEMSRAVGRIGEGFGKMSRSADRRLTLEATLLRLLSDLQSPERQPGTPSSPPIEPEAAVGHGSVPASATDAPSEPAAPVESAEAGDVTSVAEIQGIWDEQLVARLRPVARGVCRGAEVMSVGADSVTVRLAAGVPADQAERRIDEIETALSGLTGRKGIRIELRSS